MRVVTPRDVGGVFVLMIDGVCGTRREIHLCNEKEVTLNKKKKSKWTGADGGKKKQTRR